MLPSDPTIPPEVEAELRSIFQLCPPDSHCITCNGQADSVRRAFLLGVEHGRRTPPAPTPDLAEMEARKDAAYEERNRVVAALARAALNLGYRAMRTRTAIEGWSDDWHGCVCIDLPTGQVSWHYHDSHAHLFDWLPPGDMEWDGHDTPEKYRRVAAFADGRDFPTPDPASAPSVYERHAQELASALGPAPTAAADQGEVLSDKELLTRDDVLRLRMEVLAGPEGRSILRLVTDAIKLTARTIERDRLRREGRDDG